jgi:hypothetical protein
MTKGSDRVQTYPAELGTIDRDALMRCIEDLERCTKDCGACGDICASNAPDQYPGLCVELPEVCTTTKRVLTGEAGRYADVSRAMLEACAAMCRVTGDDCESYATEREHCRRCAAASRRCEQSCRELAASLG